MVLLHVLIVVMFSRSHTWDKIACSYTHTHTQMGDDVNKLHGFYKCQFPGLYIVL